MIQWTVDASTSTIEVQEFHWVDHGQEVAQRRRDRSQPFGRDRSMAMRELSPTESDHEEDWTVACAVFVRHLNYLLIEHDFRLSDGHQQVQLTSFLPSFPFLSFAISHSYHHHLCYLTFLLEFLILPTPIINNCTPRTLFGMQGRRMWMTENHKYDKF